MSLKDSFERLIRRFVAARFRKVSDFELTKYIDETAHLVTAEADKRELDELTRYQLLYRIQRELMPKFVIADHSRVILDDEGFREVFKRFSDADWTSFEHKWTLKEFLELTANVPGDIVECGVHRGGSAYFMCAAGRDRGKHVHLFDSFEGLSEPASHEDSVWKKGDLAVPEDEVLANLGEFDNFTTYKGWIPERFAEVDDKIFSFVHVDVDLEQPTADSIDFFFPRMSPGAILMLDDHGSAICPGARQAALDYFKDRPKPCSISQPDRGWWSSRPKRPLR